MICQRLNGTETIFQQKRRKHTSLRATSASESQQKKEQKLGEEILMSTRMPLHLKVDIAI